MAVQVATWDWTATAVGVSAPEPVGRVDKEGTEEGNAPKVPCEVPVPTGEPEGIGLVLAVDPGESLGSKEGEDPKDWAADGEGCVEEMGALDAPVETEGEEVPDLLGKRVLEEEGEGEGTGELVDVLEEAKEGVEPTLGESWEAVGSKDFSEDCVLPAEALASRVPCALTVDSALALGRSVPWALPVGTPDTVGTSEPLELSVDCAVGVEAIAPFGEEVGREVWVCAIPEEDATGDTVRERKEEGVEPPVACPDWLGEREGREGVAGGVAVESGVEEAVGVAVKVDPPEKVAPALSTAVWVFAEEAVGNEELAALPLGKEAPVGAAESDPVRVAAIIDSVGGAVMVGGDEGAEDTVMGEAVACTLCPLDKEGAIEGEGCDVGKLDSEGEPESRVEAVPTQLSLPRAVGELSREAWDEGEATLPVGDTVEALDTEAPRDPWAEAVLKKEGVASAVAEAVEVEAVLSEGSVSWVTVTVAHNEAARLALGRGLREADTEAAPETVNWDAEGKALRLDEGEAPREALPLGEGEELGL